MEVKAIVPPADAPPPPDRDEIARADTLARFVPAVARAYGRRPAMSHEDRILTYEELDRRSAIRAAGLLRRGAGKGCRIGIRFGNGPEWLISWAAISRIGATCVPLSTLLRPPELARVIRHADLHGLISAAGFLKHDFIDELAAAFPGLAAMPSGRLRLEDAPYLRWIVVEGTSEVPGWAYSPDWLDADVADGWLALVRRAEEEVDPGDEACIIYTSGQSADPKGVVHTHGSAIAKIAHLRAMFGFSEHTRVDATMPFFWVGGLIMSVLPSLDAGGVILCGDRTRYAAGAVIGSAADQENPFAGMHRMPALGMTETFGIYSWGREWRVPGYPITSPLDEFQPGFDVRVVDDLGRDVADGERGQIIVRGASVAARLQKTDRSRYFDDDGYFRTGDEGERDGGRIHFTGRLGDMIKTNGANVSPAEVEREILRIDGVTGCHVVGLPDLERGQLVAAAIVAPPDAGLTAAGVRDLLEKRLSSYKLPRKIIFVGSADRIPMTPTLKVHKVALAEQLAAQEEAA